MESKGFRAAKSRGREGWCVLFRHPLRLGGDGKPKRVRYGLRTRDEREADRLVEQLNRLLQDESYWTLVAKERASREFDERVVRIFYEEIEARAEDPWESREAIIPLPGKPEGYAHIQFVGPTGGGKTTLVRQLIGSDPKSDRFPSTSAAKTTVFDTEIVLRPGSYEAVVSFLSRDLVRFYIEECVVAAVSASVEGAEESVVLRRLLEHTEQRFRLSYLLGTLRKSRIDELDELLDEGLEEEVFAEEDSEVTEGERKELETRLRNFLDRIVALGMSIGPKVAEQLGLDLHALKPGDRDAFQELLEDALREDDETQLLIDDILDEVHSRFDFLTDGAYERDRSSWPVRWSFKTDNRERFIRTVNRFSSNYAPHFGRLLGPVVQGIRVAGPFRSEWIKNGYIPKLVLLDGEGLGHTPDSASSVPTAVMKRYPTADVILLVDNAVQPIQAGAQAVLRSVAAGGYESKLAVVFTHFEQVKGDNLPLRDTSARKNHVLASLENAINGLGMVLDPAAVRSLLRHVHNRVFFVARVNEYLTPSAGFTCDQLVRLLNVLEKSILPTRPIEAVPVYDLANLVLCLRTATEHFHQSWNARLGLGTAQGVFPEHWTRVKALSRRLALKWDDQYDTLRPVADLIRLVQERLGAFVANPRGWERGIPEEEVREAAIDRVRQEVHSRLLKLAGHRICLDHINEWGEAYSHRGTGSSRLRARNIRAIYEVAAPIPGETPVAEANEFLDVMRDLFREAAEAAGAKVVA